MTPAPETAARVARLLGWTPDDWRFVDRGYILCLREGRALILDWAESCLTDPDLDLGCMLPSLEFEGGPKPETIMPGRPDIAAKVSGFFAARAGQPDIPDAPFVRRVQREQLSTALPWTIRALGL